MRKVLDPGLVHLLTELADELPTAGQPAKKKNGKSQNAFFERGWSCCAEFLTAALPAYARQSGSSRSLDATPVDSMAPIFRKFVRAAASLPSMEAFFPSKWPDRARRMLPNANPHRPSTAIWGPVLAWIMLEVAAEAIDSSQPAQTAVAVFDRLRLREPLAQAFQALGLEGEEAWRAAARLKALLLVECDSCKTASGAPVVPPEDHVKIEPGAKVPQATVSSASEEVKATEAETALAAKAGEALASEASSRTPVPPTRQSPAADLLIPEQYWADPDICWLTGAHVAEGKTYLIREPYEELLWWLQLPALFNMASEPSPQRTEAAAISKKIDRALETLKAAGYRLDKLLETEEPEPTSPKAAPSSGTTPPREKKSPQSVPRTRKVDEPEPEDLRPQEPVAAQPVGPVDPDGPPEDY
jgi:hypothetical protein